jgi:hypothetical protein
MDRDKFDTLARAFAGYATRRHVGGLLLTLGIGAGSGLNLLGAAGIDAKTKKKGKKRMKRNRDNNTKPKSPPACVPECAGKACGPDGCGGFCGQCLPGAVCDANTGQCSVLCAPCQSGYVCNDSGQCVCTPNCSGKTCGSDSCGGTCGTCSFPFICRNGNCALI